MQKPPKTGLVVPILIMFAPFIALIVTILLYALVNFIFSGVTTSDTSTGISSGSSSEMAFDDTDTPKPIGRTIANIFMFLIGAASVIGFIPCIIVGAIMIGKRLDARKQARLSAQPTPPDANTL